MGGDTHVLTGGSKTTLYVCSSTVGLLVSVVLHFDEIASVLMAELYALQLAVDSILEQGLTR